MFDTPQDLSLGCTMAGKSVGDDRAGYILAALKELAKEFLGCGLIPMALHQDIQHIAMLINRAPEVGRFALDGQEDLSGRWDTFRYPTLHWNRACDVNRTRLGRVDTVPLAPLASLATGWLRSCAAAHA